MPRCTRCGQRMIWGVVGHEGGGPIALEPETSDNGVALIDENGFVVVFEDDAVEDARAEWGPLYARHVCNVQA